MPLLTNGALLGGAALGAGVSGLMGLAGSAINYQYSKALAEQQNQYNIDMWKMQADYNSPQSQMQRFSEAGLNPNLIYGQGSNGNMSIAPQKVVPNAPEISRQMAEIGKAFNIENLRTLIARRKEAEESARMAKLTRFDKEDEREALNSFGELYDYDINTGRYVFNTNRDVYALDAPNPRGSSYGNAFTRAGRLIRYLGEHDPRMMLLNQQRAYLAPQIQMLRFEQQHQPISYWVGTAGKGIKAVSDLTGVFNPSRYLLPVSDKTRGFIAPNGRMYYY